MSLIFNLKYFLLNIIFILQIPATYPLAPIELELPELDGKTAKMYRYFYLFTNNECKKFRGGKICWYSSRFGNRSNFLIIFRYLIKLAWTLARSRNSCNDRRG